MLHCIFTQIFLFVSSACSSSWGSLCHHEEKWATAAGAHPIRVHGIKCLIKIKNICTHTPRSCVICSHIWSCISVSWWAITQWWFSSFDCSKWNKENFISPANWEWLAHMSQAFHICTAVADRFLLVYISPVSTRGVRTMWAFTPKCNSENNLKYLKLAFWRKLYVWICTRHDLRSVKTRQTSPVVDHLYPYLLSNAKQK